MSMKHLMLALLSTTLACTEPGEPGSEEPVAAAVPLGSCLKPTAVPPPPSSLCPILICGDNAPTAGDGLLFDELDLFGRPNHAKVKRLGATFGGTGNPASIDIKLDRLGVTDLVTGIVHEGHELIGTVIQLEHQSGERFELRVACYQDHVATFVSGTPEYVPVYELQARRQSGVQGDKWFRVCNDGPLLPDPMWTGAPHHAVLYRGDRYAAPDAPRTKELVPNDPEDGWAFIACNGSAGSKMHLYRHTYAGGFDDVGTPTFMTEPDQRTALLKAITADYCGTGRPDFTVAGQRLAFATARNPGWFPNPYSALTGIEARWNEGGATCLGTPRYVTRESVMCGRELNPCYPDGTTMPPPDWTSLAHAITGNPL
jgi:hypothetical protein